MVKLEEMTILAIEAKDFRTEKQAMKAVSWLEERKLSEAIAVGNFGLQTLAKGTRVRLKAGAKFTTTHPKFRGKGEQTNVRARYFTVFDTHGGYIDYYEIGRADVRNPQIVWVGESSYWFYCDINDVEIVA